MLKNIFWKIKHKYHKLLIRKTDISQILLIYKAYLKTFGISLQIVIAHGRGG